MYVSILDNSLVSGQLDILETKSQVTLIFPFQMFRLTQVDLISLGAGTAQGRD
jgi:hypothetical protein